MYYFIKQTNLKLKYTSYIILVPMKYPFFILDTRITTQRRKRNKITATKAMESLPISDADDNKLRVS